jgi:ribosomal protein S18 acetylase RimI-like enzyme
LALGEMGYMNFVLDVFTENEQAVKFYKAHRYKQIDERWIALGNKKYPYAVFRKKNEDGGS